MADMTKAEMAAFVLQHMGILGAGQSAEAEDSAIVETAIDSAHSQLDRFGLVPFATSAIPDWAQTGIRDYVSALVGPTFGFGQAFGDGKRSGRRDLEVQLAGRKQPLCVIADYC